MRAPVTCVVADLGGTFLRCAIVFADGSIGTIERFRLGGDALSRTSDIWTEVIDAIAGYVDRHYAKIPPSATIAFAFPGPIAGGKITSAPTVLGGETVTPDVRSLLAARTRREVIVVNDVSAAAWYFGDRISADRFVVVTVSSGIGAKIFDRRHPLGVLDDVPWSGEIGHLVVENHPDAPICDCGGLGHLGALSSARGFERQARLAAAIDPASFSRSANVTHFGATPATLNNEEHLVPALRADDPWSLALLRSAIRPLAQVLRILCVGSGLDAIVLMGGFVEALGEPYAALVRDAVGMLSDCGPARPDMPTPIFLVGAGEEPSLIGAAAYARAYRLVS